MTEQVSENDTSITFYHENKIVEHLHTIENADHYGT